MRRLGYPRLERRSGLREHETRGEVDGTEHMWRESRRRQLLEAQMPAFHNARKAGKAVRNGNQYHTELYMSYHGKRSLWDWVAYMGTLRQKIQRSDVITIVVTEPSKRKLEPVAVNIRNCASGDPAGSQPRPTQSKR